MTHTISRPSKSCATCPALAVAGRAHCEDCARRRSATRRTNADQRAYRSAAYRSARKRLFARYGKQCWICSEDPTTSNPATAHHINHVTTDHRLSNLAVICRRDHAKLEREHDAGSHEGPMHRALARTLQARTGRGRDA